MIFRQYGRVNNSYVDGPGVRMAIFFQGCLHRCEGCQNPDSWPMYGGERADTDDIVKEMERDSLLAGITLTGGEPFLQPLAALELARAAHRLDKTVWCYTGYLFEEILEWWDWRRDLLSEIDVLVDGPFELSQRSLELDWRGSANQRVIDVRKSLEKGCAIRYGDGKA